MKKNEEKPKDISHSHRMDFVMEKIKILEKKNGKLKVESRLIPDSRRYEKIERNGTVYYVDRFEGTEFSEDVLERSLQSLEGKPIYYSPPKFEDFEEYISKRIPEIRMFFETENPKMKIFDDPTEIEMQKLLNRECKYVILSFDIINSTKIAEELTNRQNSILFALLFRELTLLIDQYHGLILKYTGDGLIAYLPEPNFIGKNDNALDCALAIRKLILSTINGILPEYGFPELHFRIGIDSGYAIMTDLGVDKIKSQKDILGFTINLACKIGQVAGQDEILIGKTAARHVYVEWRNRFEEINTDKDWNEEKLKVKKNYSIFKLN